MTTVLFWTPQKEKILREMVAAGHFARDIGAAVGATKNAVLGKIHRLGLATPDLRRNKAQYIPKPKALVKPEFTKPKAEHEQTFLAVQEAVMGLGKGECRWPYGAPHEGKIAFCKAPVYDIYSYCQGHCEEAFSNFEEARKERARLNKRRRVV